MKSRRIQTTGKSSSAGRYDQVVCPCQSCNRIKKNCNVFFMFHQTTCTFYYHFRHTFMMFRKLIKCRINDFHIIATDGLPDICNLLRALIDQKNDQMHVRIVSQNRLCHIFQQSCLTGFRRRYDHSSLSFTDRADQIYDPHGNCAARSFHYQSLIWKNRCHIFKIISSLPFTGMESVDRGHI